MVLIQICAVCIVALYYLSPGVQSATESLARLKAAGGFPFSFLATAFAGAILPEAAKRLTLRARPTPRGDMAFQLVFFGLMGVMVDFQYQLLGAVLGQGVSPDILVKKLVCDQFVGTPFVSIPLSCVAFLWKDQDFAFRRFAPGAFIGRFGPMIVSAWAFWIPVVAAVYCMPGNLQFCLFLCAQAAWSLLLLHMSGR